MPTTMPTTIPTTTPVTSPTTPIMTPMNSTTMLPPYPIPHEEAPQVYSSHSHPGVEYFRKDTTLPEREQAYCRCLLHVGKANFDSQGNLEYSGSARNPYAICHKNIHVGNPRCGQEYDFENLPDEELRGFCLTHKIHIPFPYNRAATLRAIYASKGE